MYFVRKYGLFFFPLTSKKCNAICKSCDSVCSSASLVAAAAATVAVVAAAAHSTSSSSSSSRPLQYSPPLAPNRPLARNRQWKKTAQKSSLEWSRSCLNCAFSHLSSSARTGLPSPA